MGRSPSSSDEGLKKGPWSPEEDKILTDYINQHGHGSWQALPKKAGLNRCGKSCRLRWTNYLRPDIKRGRFSVEEEKLIINLHSIHGNKWSTIASHLPGRTDNEIKNYWNTHMRKKLIKSGIDPKTHKPIYDFNLLSNLSQLLSISNMYNLINPLEIVLSLQADVAQATTAQLIQNILQATNIHTIPNNIQENLFQGSHNLDGINIMGTNGHYSQDLFHGFSMLPSTSDTMFFSSTACSSETEYLLPTGTSSLNQIDNIDKDNYTPTCTFPTSIFEDLENTLGYEENCSIWKDIAP